MIKSYLMQRIIFGWRNLLHT